MNSKQLNHMMRHPAKWVKFQATGQLPRLVRLDSPLIRLLEQIPPRDRLAIRGLQLDQRLGYSGSRRWDNAEQALNWIRPAQEMIEGEFFPAESWRIKAFPGPVTLSTLLACAETFPEDILQRLRHLAGPLATRPLSDSTGTEPLGEHTVQPPVEDCGDTA